MTLLINNISRGHLYGNSSMEEKVKPPCHSLCLGRMPHLFVCMDTLAYAQFVYNIPPNRSPPPVLWRREETPEDVLSRFVLRAILMHVHGAPERARIAQCLGLEETP